MSRKGREVGFSVNKGEKDEDLKVGFLGDQEKRKKEAVTFFLVRKRASREQKKDKERKRKEKVEGKRKERNEREREREKRNLCYNLAFHTLGTKVKNIQILIFLYS